MFLTLLVHACHCLRLMVFPVISLNIQSIIFNDDITPEQKKMLSMMKQVRINRSWLELNETPDVAQVRRRVTSLEGST